MIVSGARVVTPGRDLGVADVRIENGVIAEVGANVSPKEGGASSRRTASRFCRDSSTSIPTDAAFDKIGRGKLADGVTGFLATGLTRPEEDLAERW